MTKQHATQEIPINTKHILTEYSGHSALIRNLIKVKGTAKLTAQDEQVCLKDSKYILFEILANRTWKGGTSTYLQSQPNCRIVLYLSTLLDF